MFNLLANQADAYSHETFQCGNCNRNFEAKIITWVDVTKTPRAKRALLTGVFNVIQCTHCGSRCFSGTPFFYEDFEAGLLVAVFPAIPDKRGEVEKTIGTKYGYYPALEFFYDMTQIRMLIYFQEHYKTSKNVRALSKIGRSEEQLRKMLRFLKENPLMINIREKLTETSFGNAAKDELTEVLGQAVSTLEEMLPWPRDRRCLCGGDLSEEVTCCGKKVDLDEHEYLLSEHYLIYCPVCKESLSRASCKQCGRIYTWKLGTILCYNQEDTTRKISGALQDRQISPG